MGFIPIISLSKATKKEKKGPTPKELITLNHLQPSDHIDPDRGTSKAAFDFSTCHVRYRYIDTIQLPGLPSGVYTTLFRETIIIHHLTKD